MAPRSELARQSTPLALALIATSFLQPATVNTAADQAVERLCTRPSPRGLTLRLTVSRSGGHDPGAPVSTGLFSLRP